MSLIRSLIRTTDVYGNRVLISSVAVSSVAEASVSSQWHGIRSVIRMMDGRVIESRDDYRTIEDQMTQGVSGE